MDFLSDVRQALSSWLYWSLGSMPVGGRMWRNAILILRDDDILLLCGGGGEHYIGKEEDQQSAKTGPCFAIQQI